jgi:hypothetical protein
MINNFYGGVKETPSEPISIAMGCGCNCDCQKISDEASLQYYSTLHLVCQPLLMVLIMPIPAG